MVRYIKKVNDKVVEWTGDRMGQSWFGDNGYIAYEGSHPVQSLDIVNGESVQLPIVPAPLTWTFSQRQIRLACRAGGIENKLDALLSADPLFKQGWDEADYISSSDPDTASALAAGSFTQQEIDALIEYCLAAQV